MKISNLLVIGLVVYIGSPQVFAGQSHSEHSGGNGNLGSSCKEARIGKFKPGALAEVAPGSDFSFMVFDAHTPLQVEVTVKHIAVPVTIEDKGEIAVVHGKIPETLKATPARVNVKVKGKVQRCNSEEGWLLKITG